VLSPFFIFAVFRCLTVPLTGVINYVFCIYLSLTVNISKTVADTVKVTIND